MKRRIRETENRRGRGEPIARPRAMHRIATTIIILMLSYFGAPVFAQSYLFSVPRVEMDVTVLPAGGAIIEYDMDFENSQTGHAIDIVDVGMPTEDYSLSDMEASADGTSLTDIRKSQYVHPGVEVHLDSKTIEAGNSGNFKFRAVIPNLVFQDTTRNDYASFQITPTWFGGQYVQGSSKMTIRVHLPAGIQAEEVLYQDVPFTGKEVREDHVVVSWKADRSFTGPYRVGISFPKRVMTHIVSMSITQLLVRWYKGTFSANARIWIGIFSAIAFGFVFLRFTGGTGGCFLFLFLLFIAILYGKYDATQVYIWPVLTFLAVIVETVRHRRKTKYLPAIASVEGGGIKRGLTAPEAAILLELPVNKVVTMILFGMMKKGLIRQTTKEPVAFSVEPSPPADAIVQPYEKEALALIKKQDTQPVQKIDFGSVMESMIKSVALKMKEFDLDSTREYYKKIISRAWVEAKSIGDIEAWQKTMDEKIDWMMLDPGFQDRFRPYSDRYIPRYYRSYPTVSAGGAAAPGKPSGGGSAPRFSDVAASVSGWMQNTAQGVVAKIEGKEGGLINLGSLDKAISKAMASSGSGGGGGGGGCACACAGCACACACAGGGR